MATKRKTSKKPTKATTKTDRPAVKASEPRSAAEFHEAARVARRSGDDAKSKELLEKAGEAERREAAQQ